MSFFHDAAFTKSSIQLQVADTDAMAFLDAEFYEELRNDLDDDVQNPIIRCLHGIMFETIPKKVTVDNPELAPCQNSCTGSKRKKRKCRNQCKRKHPPMKSFAPEVFEPIPDVCKSDERSITRGGVSRDHCRPSL